MTDTPQGPADPEDEHASPPPSLPRPSRNPPPPPLRPPRPAARVASAAGRGRIVVLRADAPGPRPSPVVPPVVVQQGYAPSPGVAQGYPQPVVNPYGGYAQPPAPGGQPASAQPGYGAPAGYGQQNPYGGYTQAPAYAGGRPTHPGSIGYVEANFGPVATSGSAPSPSSSTPRSLLIGLIPVVDRLHPAGGVGAHTGHYDEFGNLTSDRRRRRARRRGRRAHRPGLPRDHRASGSGTGCSGWAARARASGKKAHRPQARRRQEPGSRSAPACASCASSCAAVVNQVFYLSYLWMLWDADKQTLADKAVHSTVVVLPKRLSRGRLDGRPAGIRPVRARSSRGRCAPR